MSQNEGAEDWPARNMTVRFLRDVFRMYLRGPALLISATVVLGCGGLLVARQPRAAGLVALRAVGGAFLGVLLPFALFKLAGGKTPRSAKGEFALASTCYSHAVFDAPSHAEPVAGTKVVFSAEQVPVALGVHCGDALIERPLTFDEQVVERLWTGDQS